jgi:hypothetical protein
VCQHVYKRRKRRKEELAALKDVSGFIELNAEGKFCLCQFNPVICFKILEKISMFLEWMAQFDKGAASILILWLKPQQVRPFPRHMPFN